MIKKLLLLSIILSITIPFADAAPLSDKTGLKFTFPVKSDGHSFIVDATANFNITNLDFDKEKKTITLFISSSVENNFFEISFPNTLIGGDYSILLNDVHSYPKLHEGNTLTFITMDFSGVGTHKIEIIGTTSLDFFNVKDILDYEISDGYVDNIEGNQSTNSLIFTLFDPGNKGKLSVTLSENIITPFDDGSFSVFVNNIESGYTMNDNVITMKLCHFYYLYT